MCPYMIYNLWPITEYHTAQVTCVWFLTSMFSNVATKRRNLRKSFITNVTGIRLYTCVTAEMGIKTRMLLEWLLANMTSIWYFSSMNTIMYLQVWFLRKPLVTHLTCKWLLSSMWSIMYIKEWTAAKWLVAYVTFIWLLYWFHWRVLSIIGILSCANWWIITKRQTSRIISCSFLKNVDKNQTIKHTAWP